MKGSHSFFFWWVFEWCCWIFFIGLSSSWMILGVERCFLVWWQKWCRNPQNMICIAFQITKSTSCVVSFLWKRLSSCISCNGSGMDQWSWGVCKGIVHIYNHIYIYLYLYFFRAYIFIYTHIYTYIYIYSYIHIYIYINICPQQLRWSLKMHPKKKRWKAPKLKNPWEITVNHSSTKFSKDVYLGMLVDP